MLWITVAAALLKPNACTHCRILQDAKIDALRARLRRKAALQRMRQAVVKCFAW